MNYFDILPDDALLHIFTFIPYDLVNIIKVCRRWQTLAKWEPLWWNVHVKFGYGEKELDNIHLETMKVAPVLGSLDLYCDSQSTAYIIHQISQHHPTKIKELVLDSLKIQENELLKLFQWFGANLEKLEMRQLIIMSAKDEHEQLLVDLPRLKSLESDAEGGRILKVTPTTCPNLREICLWIDAESTTLIELEQYPVICGLKNQLKTLHICAKDLLFTAVHWSFINDFQKFIDFGIELLTFMDSLRRFMFIRTDGSVNLSIDFASPLRLDDFGDLSNIDAIIRSVENVTLRAPDLSDEFVLEVKKKFPKLKTFCFAKGWNEFWI